MQELLAYLHQIGLNSLIFWHFDATYRTVSVLSALYNLCCLPAIYVSGLFYSYDTENSRFVHCGVQQSERIAS